MVVTLLGDAQGRQAVGAEANEFPVGLFADAERAVAELAEEGVEALGVRFGESAFAEVVE